MEGQFFNNLHTKVVGMDVDKIMGDSSTFHEAFVLYRKLFRDDLPDDPSKITKEQTENMCRFVTGYKLGRAVGRSIGEEHDATAIFA